MASQETATHSLHPHFLVIGGAHMDQIGRALSRYEPGQSNPGTLTRSLGGVGSNLARSLRRLDWTLALSTVVGDDQDGRFVLQGLEQRSIDTAPCITLPDHPTATYTAIEEPSGALVAGLADMKIYDHYPADRIAEILAHTPSDTKLIVDTNLNTEVLEQVAQHKGTRELIICAVSGPKAVRAQEILTDIDLLFCNEAEAAILADEYADLPALPEILFEEGVKRGVITKGDAGVTAWDGEDIWHLPAPPVKVRSTNGAGDCLAACTLHGLQLHNSLKKALPYGMAGANLALMSSQAVPDMLNTQILEACLADTPAAE